MAHIWILASLISSSWNLPSNELALKNDISKLDAEWLRLDWQLKLWILLVVIGVAIEVVVVIVEYLHERSDFLRGIVHAPEAPIIWLYIVGVVGAGLVAVGVAGEFFIHISAGRVETDLRNDNGQLVSLISERASQIEQANTKLKIQLAKIQRANGRRYLTPQEKNRLRELLAPFHLKHVGIVSVLGESESAKFRDDLSDVLLGPGVRGGGWLTPGLTSIMPSVGKRVDLAPPGVTIVVRNPLKPPPATIVLKSFFDELDFESQISKPPSPGQAPPANNTFWIIVGPK
jgi:hypothetical protein